MLPRFGPNLGSPNTIVHHTIYIYIGQELKTEPHMTHEQYTRTGRPVAREPHGNHHGPQTNNTDEDHQKNQEIRQEQRFLSSQRGDLLNSNFLFQQTATSESTTATSESATATSSS